MAGCRHSRLLPAQFVASQTALTVMHGPERPSNRLFHPCHIARGNGYSLRHRGELGAGPATATHPPDPRRRPLRPEAEARPGRRPTSPDPGLAAHPSVQFQPAKVCNSSRR